MGPNDPFVKTVKRKNFISGIKAVLNEDIYTISTYKAHRTLVGTGEG